MRRKLLWVVMATATCFTSMLHADYIFHSSSTNACEYIPGKWKGTGQATNWILGTCVYHGAGTATSLDSTGHFSMTVTSDKDSGSFLCPKHTTKKVNGVCVKGLVTITTEYGNLTGDFTKDAGHAEGTLSVAKGMSAEVTMQFQRVD